MNTIFYLTFIRNIIPIINDKIFQLFPKIKIINGNILLLSNIGWRILNTSHMDIKIMNQLQYYICMKLWTSNRYITKKTIHFTHEVLPKYYKLNYHHFNICKEDFTSRDTSEHVDILRTTPRLSKTITLNYFIRFIHK